jgi:PAS domain S-box-containing protein
MSTRPRLHLLVVDDSADDASALCERLESVGYDVDATRVSSAVEMKSALEHGRYDLVLSDYHLECFSGLQALRLVQASGLDLPFIIVSGHIGEARAIELMRAGARDYVTKEHPGRLAPAVERELREAHERRERRRAEEALRAREQQYRELFENASDMVFTIDLQGRFTSVNRACEAITGYTREEALTLNIGDVLAPEDRAITTRLASVSAGHEAQRRLVLLTIIGKHRRRIVTEVSWRAIVRGGAVVSIEAIARDLTERRRLEEQLRQAQKMEAVGRLAGGIAHDFNNLLMAVTGYSELLLDRLAHDDSLRRNAEEIRNAAARAAGLTRQLLTFSRKQVMRTVLVDLNAVVAELESMLRRLIGEDIAFSTALVAGTAQVKADRGQIEQVIMNLVVNARDAMPGGGRLLVATRRLSIELPENDGYPGLPPGEYVALEVQDTGAGMSEEVQSHLFEPFFTTKEPGKGTGLGLSTAYGIVAQSGGRIIVQSAEGQGSTFRVLLPAEQGAAPKAQGRRGFASLPRGTETVLLVEDEQGVRELIRDFLLRCGYTVLEAADPTEALALFDAKRDVLQLLITDVVMPQMNGRELAERLVARRPGLGVLFMSGYTDDQVLAHGVARGAGFLQKPFTPDVLARKVREVLDGPGPA